MFFLGSLIAGVALAGRGRLVAHRARFFRKEYHDAMIEAAGSTEDLDQMTLVQTFELWEKVQQRPRRAESCAEYLQS